MKVTIQDRDALQRLSLVDVRAYLEAQSWSAVGRYGDVATIFENKNLSGSSFEILLPIQENVADFAARMSDAVTVLSQVEDRDEISVFHDLIKSGFDVVRFRAPNADNAGTIPLQSGVALYDHARDVVVAAANATVKPKRAYRGNSSDRAKQYLDTLRLGQTEVGSYVLTVLSPVQPSLITNQASLFPDLDIGDEPFSRAVTLTLARSLHATKHAVNEAAATGKLAPFEAAVDFGVSSNLCEAIAKLAQEGSGVNISLSWAPVRRGLLSNVNYTFTEDNARVLSEAAAAFRESEPQSDITIEGFVVALDRKPEEFDGKAKIRGFVDGKIKTISADFLSPDYKKVVSAHDRKLRVKVDGDLIKRGVFQVLGNARNLVIFEDDELDSSEGVR
jgi:hypothetical protein